ncbi:MAG: hypothetical protein QF903_15145 [Planctomycetota bacterium]|jgi:hypothetical protein|nr:hypothetical protein [Planctomycetota bacterium]MDP6990807.1 hypothetical protein [Planctomycetota bacterium]
MVPRAQIPAAALLALLACCGAESGAGASPAALARAFAWSDSLEVFLPHEGAARRARDAARLLSARTSLEVAFPQRGDRGRSDRPRVVGGLFDDPAVLALLRRVGAEPTAGGGLSFLGIELAREGEALAACFADPERAGLPLTVLAAGSPEALAHLVDDLRPTARPSARVWRRGQPCLAVELALDGTPRQETLRDIARERSRALRRVRIAASDDEVLLSAVPEVDSERAAEYAAAVTAARSRVREWVGAGPPLRPFAATLVGGAAIQRNLVGAVGLSVPDGLVQRELVLLASGVPHDGGRSAARAALRARLGEPTRAWVLEGAAIDAAGSWWGTPLTDLATAAATLALAEIVDPAAIDRHSQHALAPARGLLFRCLRTAPGAGGLPALWEAGEPALSEADWRAWLAALGEAPLPVRRPGPAPRRRYAGGVAFDSDGRPGGGLCAPGLDLGLESAALVGADAVSFTSFFHQRPPSPVFAGDRNPQGLQAAEGDAALALAVARARAAGARSVLLQPHLLLSESAGHSAWRKRTTSADWEEFFAHLRRALVHYALLAERTGCDVLCVGTELWPAHGDGGGAELAELKEARWREVIGAVREHFHGALTYAARWPGEARRIPFWDAVDLVGVTLYPDLEVPRDAERLGRIRGRIARTLEQVGELALEQGRGALIVEVGFRSTTDAALEPELATGGLDLDEQALLWDGFARALAAARAADAPLAGCFVWCWRSELHPGGRLDRGFTPCGKPAQALLRPMFRAP